MAITLGKRKRKEPAVPISKHEDASSDDDAAARALFQKAFEAKFNPLEKVANATENAVSEINDSLDDDSWDGLSEDDSVNVNVEIVQHQALDRVDPTQRKRELKAFLSGKDPAIDLQSSSTTLAALQSTGDADTTEVANLQNDLALQRLLKESHLLDSSTFGSKSASEPEGKGRIKALDLRLQDLGSKSSHLAQEKMPISHRKGIVAKASSRESTRRSEAKENGVVLEKFRGGAKSVGKRERGVDGPGVGKFRGGMLKLSARDVKSIESSGERRGRGGKSRGGAKRGKR
ncbi:pre-rRNA processing and 40S ribosomal subunit assembly [Oleoguttula sp. CCFEE 5521]